jgi:hypothetical protein
VFASDVKGTESTVCDQSRESEHVSIEGNCSLQVVHVQGGFLQVVNYGHRFAWDDIAKRVQHAI